MDFAYISQQEIARHRSTINLIASENYPSYAVLKELSSPFSIKYGEGFPYKRYYAGNTYTDLVEDEVCSLALRAFCPRGGYDVNVQIPSGSIANALAYLGVLEYGDTVLSLELSHGGHLSHMHSTSSWNKFFKHASYSLVQEGGEFMLDISHIKQAILTHLPQLLIMGYSSFPSQYSFKEICSFAHAHHCMVLADISHISGLVVTQQHDSPFETVTGDFNDCADIVTSTTHKTLRGPRSAVIFSRNEIPLWIKAGSFWEGRIQEVSRLSDMIQKAVFPGMLGGPHFNKISSLGIALQEILGEKDYGDGRMFSTYIQHVRENAHAFETVLHENGLMRIMKTGTHLSLHILPDELDSLKVQTELESIGVVTNRNTIPCDTKSPFRPSGMRFGSAAITSRGATREVATEIALVVVDCVFSRQHRDQLQNRVQDIISNTFSFYSDAESGFKS